MDTNQNESLAAEQQVLLLPALSIKELQAKYAEVFGLPPRSHERRYLVRRIAWRLQAIASGGLSGRARQQAAVLAKDAEMRLAPPAVMPKPEPPRRKPRRPRGVRRVFPLPGTVLSRPYRGRLFEVKVLSKGYEYDGHVYGSLSAVADAITGARWNGYRFFGIAMSPAPPESPDHDG